MKQIIIQRVLKRKEKMHRRSVSSNSQKKSNSKSSSSPNKKPLSLIATNPFESRSNKRTKFEVLGRKVRGADRNVALARSDAEKKRNDTILQEWKAIGKNNRFQDRRFGENNTTIDDETKMLVRFQKERLRQINVGKRARKFNLDDDNGGGGYTSNDFTLTHGGQIINENNYTDEQNNNHDNNSDDGDDPFMDTSLHFGGGNDESRPSWRGSAAASVPAWMTNGSNGVQPSITEGGEERRRSHKEIMEEVIAKSKAARADRAREKADTNDLIESLDNQANEVIRLIHQSQKYNDSSSQQQEKILDHTTVIPMVKTSRQKENNKHEQSIPTTTTTLSSSSSVKDKDNYDSLLSALARQPRSAAARDRSKTAEELATEEAERLHELEELRRSRARGETNETDKPKDTELSRGRSTATDTKLGGDDLAPTLRDEGGVMLTARQKRAAPSTVSIWDYAKKKDDDDDSKDDSDENESDDDSDDDDDEDNSDDDEDLEDLDDENDVMVDNEDDEDDDNIDDEVDDNDDDNDTVDDEDEDHDDDDEKHVPRTHSSALKLGSLEEMPYTLPCPTNRKEFHALIQRYCAPRPSLPSSSPNNSSQSGKKRSRDASGDTSALASPDMHNSPEATERVYELIRRLRTLYAVSLKATNLSLLKQLYRIFIESIQYIGTHTHLYQHRLPVWYIEPIAHHIFSMNQEGPLRNEISTVWKEIVTALHERIEKSLNKGITHGMRIPTGPSNIAERVTYSPNNSWLTGSDILLIKIANGIFPSTDFRHPIVTAFCASLCQILVYGPIISEIDMCAATVAASLAMDFTARGRRYIPEVIQTCNNILALYTGKIDELEHKTIDDKLSSVSSSLSPNTSTKHLSTSTTFPVTLPDIAPNFRPLQKTLGTNPHWLLQYALTAESDTSTKGIPFAIITDNYTNYPNDDSQYTRASVAKQGLVAILSLVKSVANLLVPSTFPTGNGTDSNATVVSSTTNSVTFSGAKLMDASVAPNGNASKEIRGKSYGLSMNTSGNTFTITNTDIPFPCAPEILDPMINCMAAMLALIPSLQKSIKTKGFTTPSASYLSNLLTTTMRELIVTRDTIATLRIPMRLQEQSGPPPSVRMLAPLLEDVNAPFSSNSTAIATKYPHLDPAVAREKEEIRQLQKAVKKEKRGAVRELRRDREFIVRAVDKAKAKRDGEREVVYKGLITDLQRQQAQMNQVLKKSKGLMDDKEKQTKDGTPWMGVGRTGKTKADRMARKQASRDSQH